MALSSSSSLPKFSRNLQVDIIRMGSREIKKEKSSLLGDPKIKKIVREGSK